MFNVTVINIKKSAKHIAILLFVLIFIFIMTKMIPKFQSNEIFQVNLSEKLISCLSIEIPAISGTYYKANTTIKEDGEEEPKANMIDKLLGIELAQVEEKNEIVDEINDGAIETAENNENAENNVGDTVQSTDIPASSQTEIVTQNPISESFNVEIEGVKIKNETSFSIDSTILAQELDINKSNFLIFHTHTCESYTPSELYPYQQTGNFRTTDLNYSVSRVGDELSTYLTGFGLNVYHDKTYHDYPAYSGSYDRSNDTVESILQTNSSDIIIDLHRDAIGSKSNYDPSVKIGEDVAAQLMFVIGTNGGGLYHPNWKTNLKFAIEIQKKANEMYPGLFKPMIVRNSRYNQHLGKAACIIEVGATGNTLEQCLTSMKYLAKVFEEYAK